MHTATEKSDRDKDALHILPLSMLPVETAGLRKARLIKNWHLEGVVELFCGSETGSGQVPPSELKRVFDFRDDQGRDIEMISTLSPLPSYDVYSLRVELRRLGIAVDDHADLQLSEEKRRELTGYMRQFTRPLVETIFGADRKEVSDLNELTRLLLNPDRGSALRNIEKLSRALNIEIGLIPAFLQNYGDTYLSLAFYQKCLEENRPLLRDFFSSLEQIRNDNSLRRDHSVIRACATVEKKLRRTEREIENVLELFRARTANMWDQVSGEDFREIEKLVTDCQSSIGGALCAITVKMRAWEQTFSYGDTGNLPRRADFLRSQILPGIAGIKEVRAAG